MLSYKFHFKLQTSMPSYRFTSCTGRLGGSGGGYSTSPLLTVKIYFCFQLLVFDADDSSASHAPASTLLGATMTSSVYVPPSEPDVRLRVTTTEKKRRVSLKSANKSKQTTATVDFNVCNCVDMFRLRATLQTQRKCRSCWQRASPRSTLPSLTASRVCSSDSASQTTARTCWTPAAPLDFPWTLVWCAEISTSSIVSQ